MLKSYIRGGLWLACEPVWEGDRVASEIIFSNRQPYYDMAECFPEKLRQFSDEQVCQGVQCKLL